MSRQTSKLAIIDVGHGNSAVLHDTNGIVIIDAGPKSFLMEYLLEKSIFEIDVMLISHADQDHIEGLVALLSEGRFKIKKIRLNTDSIKSTKIWNDLVYLVHRAVANNGLDFLPALVQNFSGEYDRGNARIEICGPSVYLAAKGPGSNDRTGSKLSSNSISAIVRIVNNGQPVALLAADLDEVGLNELEYCNIDISAPVLIFPHHGGRPANADLIKFTQRVCKKVSPETIIFSIGRGRYGTPQPIIISTIKACLPNAHIVCTQLSEHCASALPKIAPTYLSGEFARGRLNRTCCAGTITIDLSAPARSILPIYGDHRSYIIANFPSALCR